MTNYEYINSTLTLLQIRYGNDTRLRYGNYTRLPTAETKST